jgi:hypothetical protein
MQYEASMNVQDAIRPGMDVDTYYPTATNSEKQMHATVTDNRFFINLPSLNSGSSSTVTFNPNEGLAEVILTMQLPAIAGNGGQGLAMPEGWGYSMIRRIGYRYGSSQLFYITGAQNLMQAIALCEDSGKKQQLFFLGGQALLSIDDWSDAGKRTCYVYLRLPHSSPALSGGALPFPSDVLTAPIQLQIDLADFASVITRKTVGAVAPDVLPTTLASAVINWTQVSFQDSSDLVARRFDMSKHALTIPLCDGWTQEEVQFPFTTGDQGQFQLSLTGCKAGDLKKLRLFFTDPLDTAGSGNIIQQNLWYAPSQLTFSINGLIYLDSTNGSWLLTNLLRRRQPPVVTYSALQAPVPAIAQQPFSALPTTSTFVEIDLSQPHTRGDSQEVALVHGVPVMNSVLNLTGVMPLDTPGTGKKYTLHVEYVLNCSWMASRGSAEFVF